MRNNIRMFFGGNEACLHYRFFLCLSEGIPLTQRLVLYTLEVGDCLFCVHASMLHRFMKIALALNSYRKRQKTAYRKGLSFRLGVDTSAHGCANVA